MAKDKKKHSKNYLYTNVSDQKSLLKKSSISN